MSIALASAPVSDPAIVRGALQDVHGCPDDCQACAAAVDARALDLILDWVAFVESPAAVRVAKHVKATGQPFPTFTFDPVVQFCIEEACLLRVQFDEHRGVAGLGGEPEPIEGAASSTSGLPVPVWADPAAQHARQWAANRGQV